jgi:hypothetical protein
MKLVDCTKFKIKRDSDQINYLARYQGPGITFSQLKAWASKAERFDDEMSAIKLRKWIQL